MCAELTADTQKEKERKREKEKGERPNFVTVILLLQRKPQFRTLQIQFRKP